MGSGCRSSHECLSAKWYPKVNKDVAYVLQSPSTPLWQHSHSEIIFCCMQFYSRMDEMISLEIRSPCWETQRLIKTRFLQNVETSTSWANVHTHSGAELRSSHRRRPLVSGAGSTQFRLKRWAVVPSAVQKVNDSSGWMCDWNLFFCPAVPPVTNAGEVHDRHCPRDGVPQQQELHPQRPRCSQLHVSTISASTFFTLSVPKIYFWRVEAEV